MPYAEKLLEMFQSTLPTRGSDTKPGLAVGNICVSIHAPHEGERPAARAITPAIAMFQSTLPTRGSDADFLACIQDTVWVSIHAPHEGERLDKMHTYELIKMFQSTLPTRGSDSRHLFHRRPDPCFNPRSPRGGATKKALADGEMRYVSIHAPHEGERLALINHEIDGNGFNPRSPRGGATQY